LPMPADPTRPEEITDVCGHLATPPYQGSAPGPLSAGSRRQPARTTYRGRPLETVANRSAPMGCGPNVDQAKRRGRYPLPSGRGSAA
jgi:hypothetical protein